MLIESSGLKFHNEQLSVLLSFKTLGNFNTRSWFHKTEYDEFYFLHKKKDSKLCKYFNRLGRESELLVPSFLFWCF